MVLVGGAAGVYWGCEVTGSKAQELDAGEGAGQAVDVAARVCFYSNHIREQWTAREFEDVTPAVCSQCVAKAIEDARRAESEAIADFVALRGSESGYTHVEDLVAAIRSRGAADPTSGEERER